MSVDLSDWTLVFDLDGTLVETAPDLHAALNHTLASKKLDPVELSEIRQMIGDGAKALIRKGLTHHGLTPNEDEISDKLWPMFIEHYLANITRLSRPFERVVDTLDELQARGARLSVCTNKAQNLAEEVLVGLDLSPYFQATIGGDAASQKKPHGSHILETISQAGGHPSRAIMIGDSQTDERAARHAKLPFIFFSLGYGDLSDEPYHALKIVDHWSDMQVALSELIEHP